jgi:protease-4
LAASGGYYIACNAHKIYAESNTITGSIGVFGTLPNFTQAANKYGINTQQLKTHERANNYSPFVSLDDNTRAYYQESVEKIYSIFVNRVAKGRNMSFAQVDSIGQGRVWSGKDALRIGLVDKIGGMDDALKEAASLAKIKEYRTQDFPEYEKSFEDILAQFGLAQSKESLIKEELGEENYLILQRLKRLSQLKGVQAIMPYEIKIN